MLKARAKLLQKYLCDEQKELQALYALQALVVTLEQPASKSQAAGTGLGGELPEGGRGRGKGRNPGNVRWPLESGCSDGRWLPSLTLFPCLHMEGVRRSLAG